MKRVLSIILVSALALSFSSCATNSKVQDEVESSTSEVVTSEETTEETTTTAETEDSTEPTEEEIQEVVIKSMPDDLLEGLPEFTKEEVYNQVTNQILMFWASFNDFSETHDCYNRERNEFNKIMQLEMIMESTLRGHNNQEHKIYTVFDNIFNCEYPKYGLNANRITPEYLSDVMSILFGVDITEDEIIEIFSDTSDSYLLNYDESFGCIVVNKEVTYINPYYVGYDMVSFDDNSFTCDVFYYNVEVDGDSPTVLQSICKLNVSVDWNEDYPLGFIVTDVQISYN